MTCYVFWVLTRKSIMTDNTLHYDCAITHQQVDINQTEKHHHASFYNCFYLFIYYYLFTTWWCTEANEATHTHCHNPLALAYLIWAYYAHGWQRRCQEDPVSLPSGRWRRQLRRPRIMWLSTVQQDLKQHHLTLPEAADLAQNRSLVEDDVDVWRYAIVSCMPETTTTTVSFA